MHICADARAVLGGAVSPCAELKRILDSAEIILGRSLAGADSAPDTVRAICDLVYRHGGMRFDTSRDDVQAVFPHSAVERRSGSCLGVSLLLLLAGERLGLPLHGVMPPAHFFVRYDNGVTRINIEPNRAGWRYSDEEYRVKYGIGADSWYDLRNLTIQETAAALEYNLANIYRQRGKAADALRLYEAAVAHFPTFAEAWGNLGLTRQGRGDWRGAIDALVRARILNPGLCGIHRNLGILYRQAGNRQQACAEFHEGLRRNPADSALSRLASECGPQR